MKTIPGLVMLCSTLLASPVHSQERDSSFDSKWSFGLQAAPALFGLSLRRQFNEIWRVQGILQPDGDTLALGARVLRTATQKKFWQSYLFAGLASRSEENYYYAGNLDGSDGYRDRREYVTTLGLGVEWAWAAKNSSLPPLSWSLELGLGYRVYDHDEVLYGDSNEFILAAGAAIHYLFE